MAKAPKKQTTIKTTDTQKTPQEIMQDIVNENPFVSSAEQAMSELTELSQELGLYEVTDNPLIKDTPTTSQNATESALETLEGESNTVVTPQAESGSDGLPEGLNATETLDGLLDKITDENKHEEVDPTLPTLKDGWGRPLPTKLIVIQSINYTDLVSQVLYAASLGAELDRSYRILSVVPYRIRLMLPADKYDKFSSKEDMMVFDEGTTYNRVLVKSFNLYNFWENIIKIGKKGAIVVPRHVVQKVGGYMVPIFTKAPVSDTPESRVSHQKVKYTKEELELFSLEDLKIVAGWYEGIPSMNSKQKYVKEILDAQGK